MVIDRAHVRRRVRVLRELWHVETAEHQLEASVCHAGDAFQITVPRAVVVVDGAGIGSILIGQIVRAAILPAVPAQREIAFERIAEIRRADRQRPVVFARPALVDEQGKSIPRVFGQRQRCPITVRQTAQQIPVLAVIRPEQLRQIVRRLAGVQLQGRPQIVLWKRCEACRLEQRAAVVEVQRVDLARVAEFAAAAIQKRVGVIKICRDLYRAAAQHLHVRDAQIRAAAEARHVLNDRRAVRCVVVSALRNIKREAAVAEMIPQNAVHKALREVILPVGLLVIIARVCVIRPVQKQHKQLLRRQVFGRIKCKAVVDKRDLRADQNAVEVLIRQKARVDRHTLLRLLLRDGQPHGLFWRHPADGGDHAVFNVERHDCLVAHDKHCGNAVRVRNAAVFAHV